MIRYNWVNNMKTYKKRKIKIKKKNMLIFTITLITSIFLLKKWTNLLINTFKEPKDNKTTKEKSTSSNKQIDLEYLKQQLDYYNEDFQKRYEEYQKNNKKLSNIQVVKEVNMHLDLKPYEDTEEAKYQNTEKILVNKHYFLTKDYVPKNLETISNKYALNGMKLVDKAKDAFEKMAKDAEKQELSIIAMSSYRSYSYQVNLYNRYVKKDGKEKADTYSGRPGHSEHQTGLAIDVYNKKEDYTNFEKTDEYKWMQKHAHEYGFILRFPKEKEKETGYQFESWHYRYVGEEIAKYIKNNNISLEEYYATKIKDW